MTDLVIDLAAARFLDRHVSARVIKGWTLVAATLAACGDCTALYDCRDGSYQILWVVNDPDADDEIRNECGAADLEQAKTIYKQWVSESEAVPVVPNWDMQAEYDEQWGELPQPWWSMA